MNDLDHALAQVSQIRLQLAATTRFRGYAPEAVAVIGMVALLVTVAQSLWPARYAASDRQLVLAWGMVLVVSSLAIATEAIARARSQHGGMARSMLHSAMRVVLPITAVGAVIAAVVLAYAPQMAWIVPGIWLMLIGLVAFASYATMPRAIIWPGIWYIAAGAGVMVLAGRSGALAPWMIGGPMVVGHIAIALILHHGGRHGHDA